MCSTGTAATYQSASIRLRPPGSETTRPVTRPSTASIDLDPHLKAELDPKALQLSGPRVDPNVARFARRGRDLASRIGAPMARRGAAAGCSRRCGRSSRVLAPPPVSGSARRPRTSTAQPALSGPRESHQPDPAPFVKRRSAARSWLSSIRSSAGQVWPRLLAIRSRPDGEGCGGSKLEAADRPGKVSPHLHRG